MYELILFDLGDVCFKNDFDTRKKLFLERTGISLNLNEGHTSPAYLDFLIGSITTEEYFKALLALNNKTEPSAGHLKKIYSELYVETTTLNDELISLLNSTPRDLELVTTTNELHEVINKERGLFEPFSKRHFSHKLHAIGINLLRHTMPNPHYETERILLIDNDLYQVYQGRKIGMDVIHYTDNKHLLDELANRGITL